jgi:LacI family transcriptional regulator
MPTPRATQQDIAEALGVRQTTVSRALADDPRVKPATKRRIVAAAERLGYRPNLVGRAMRQGRFGTVAVLESTASHRGHAFGEFLYLLHDALAARGLHLVLSRLADGRLGECAFVRKRLDELMVDGLVIDYCVAVPPALHELVEHHRLPATWVNVKDAPRGVWYDDRAGARAATEHLLALGHRKIAYLSYFNDPASGARSVHHSMVDRRDGYCAAMKRRRVRERVIHFDSPGRDLDRAAFAREFLAAPDRPTAILTYTEVEAAHLVLAAARLGVRIPQDLSIIAHHWTAYRSTGVDVTTVVLPVAAAAARSAQMIARLIQHPDARVESAALVPKLWMGASCAPPGALVPA